MILEFAFTLLIIARIYSDEYPSEYRNKDADDYPSPKDKDKDEGMIITLICFRI